MCQLLLSLLTYRSDGTMSIGCEEGLVVRWAAPAKALWYHAREVVGRARVESRAGSADTKCVRGGYSPLTLEGLPVGAMEGGCPGVGTAGEEGGGPEVRPGCGVTAGRLSSNHVPWWDSGSARRWEPVVGNGGRGLRGDTGNL
jgi:hypothetical protein